MLIQCIINALKHNKLKYFSYNQVYFQVKSTVISLYGYFCSVCVCMSVFLCSNKVWRHI